MRIERESPIRESPRVVQVRGIFDLPAEKTSRVAWDVDLPLGERAWRIGLVVGPSGCGKTTIARRVFAEADWHGPDGDTRAMADALARGAVVDAFPASLGIGAIAGLLSAVGFSSPPAWLRPFSVLSTGQKFRVRLALALAQAAGRDGATVVFDEFTSVVDRTVARIGSAALAKLVRSGPDPRFVAVTCHEDVEEWLQPDWTYRPAEGRFAWRSLRRRPEVGLDVVRCAPSAWELFAPHHYLSGRLVGGATCFLASWQGQPTAFSAWLTHVGSGPKAKREHRTVTLPDFQGVGIGNALSDFAASLWAGLGYRTTSTTTHPALIQSRRRSARWEMTRAPAFQGGHDRLMRHATTRMTASFRYVGPGLARAAAQALLETTS